MGVSGAGKTTVGLEAAALAGVRFLDADDLHSPANVEKMRSGIPLTDEDRAPWLDAVAASLRDGAPCIMACSALRRSYRDRLRQDAPLTAFVLLRATRELLSERLAGRTGHFMTEQLLDSQLATLDDPEDDEVVIEVDAARSVQSLAEEIAAVFDRPVLG